MAIRAPDGANNDNDNDNIDVPPKRCPSINYHQDNCADKVNKISKNLLRDDRFEHLFSTS